MTQIRVPKSQRRFGKHRHNLYISVFILVYNGPRWWLGTALAGVAQYLFTADQGQAPTQTDHVLSAAAFTHNAASPILLPLLSLLLLILPLSVNTARNALPAGRRYEEQILQIFFMPKIDRWHKYADGEWEWRCKSVRVYARRLDAPRSPSNRF